MNRSAIKPFARLLGPALALSALAIPGPAFAATVSDTFQVSITIQKACSVTANASADIDLGTVASTATNTTGSGTVTVTCSKTTPYYIGLAPSNANTAGAGTMAGTGGNTDTVPYQLSSTAGPSGTVWGNTATASAVGNGVSGTGTGSSQTLTIYVTAPSANYTPDTYTDTVTINVHY